MNKILLYPKYSGSFYDKYLFNLINEINKDWEIHVISFAKNHLLKDSNKLIYHINDKLEYWSKNNDYKELEYVFNYSIEKKINRVHLIRTNYESFFSMINNYPDIKRLNISFGIFGHREIYESRSRFNLIKNIMKKNCISNAIIHSISNDLKPPNTNFCSSKLLASSDPLYDNIKDYEGIKEKSVSEKIRYTFFGMAYYGKGLDIYSEALDFLDEKTTLKTNHTFAGNLKLSPKNEFLNRKAIILDRYFDEIEVLNLFKNTDVLVLPYRKTYENVTSGVLVQAALSKTLVIAPDIYPFNKVINEYKLGLLFKVEDSQSLCEVINFMTENILNLKKSANFNKFVSKIASWDSICRKLKFK